MADEHSAPCEAALAFLKEIVRDGPGHPNVFSDTAIPVPDSIYSDGWWAVDHEPGEPNAPPPADLFARYQALGGVSAVSACEEVRALLFERGVMWGEGPVRAAAREDLGRDRFQATIHSATLPAVSEDGRDALLEYGYQAGPLAGRGTMIWRKRGDDGVWRDYATCMRWIS